MSSRPASKLHRCCVSSLGESLPKEGVTLLDLPFLPRHPPAAGGDCPLEVGLKRCWPLFGCFEGSDAAGGCLADDVPGREFEHCHDLAAYLCFGQLLVIDVVDLADELLAESGGPGDQLPTCRCLFELLPEPNRLGIAVQSIGEELLGSAAAEPTGLEVSPSHFEAEGVLAIDLGQVPAEPFGSCTALQDGPWASQGGEPLPTEATVPDPPDQVFQLTALVVRERASEDERDVAVGVPAVGPVGDLVGLDQADEAEPVEELAEGPALAGGVPCSPVCVKELGETLAGVVTERQCEEFDAHALIDGSPERSPDFFGSTLADFGTADRADPDESTDAEASEVSYLPVGFDLYGLTEGSVAALAEAREGGERPEAIPLGEAEATTDDSDLSVTPSDLRGDSCP